jgi:hypothetical protein
MTDTERAVYRKACKAVIQEWNETVDGDELDLSRWLNNAIAQERRRLIDIEKGKVRP